MIAELLNNLISGISNEIVILLEIGIIIIFATFIAFILRILKQPLIPAYIITGIIIGPSILGLIKNESFITALSQIGITFLIFVGGLEIKFNKLKEVGKVSIAGGIIQVFILFLIAFFISILLGISGKAPIYIGLVISFSSTMIVVKLLSDKREINSLHGRIIIGILLIQDIVALIALMVLSSDLTINGIFISLAKALIFIVVAFLFTKVINPIFNYAANNSEILLLVSISFLFLFSICSYLSFQSLAIGAFFAGVILANSDFRTEIEGKISPLRDFFAVIFFVSLGMQLKFIYGSFIRLLLILLILVIVIKPIITMFTIRLFGYKKRTSFLIGNALAQTSEFSFIIITLGFSLGHIDQFVFSTLTLLTILTMSITVYLINYEKKISRFLDWPLNILNKYHTREEELEYLEEDGKKVILFGCHRMGSLLLKELEAEKKDVLVIDYNPEIIKYLMKKKIPCIYGDFINEEVLKKSGIKNAEIIISTIPDFEDNMLLIKKAKRMRSPAIIFIVADRISEAERLYEAGADYIILPQVIGGQKASEIIKKLKGNKMLLKNFKKGHIKYLETIHHILY